MIQISWGVVVDIVILIAVAATWGYVRMRLYRQRRIIQQVVDAFNAILKLTGALKNTELKPKGQGRASKRKK